MQDSAPTELQRSVSIFSELFLKPDLTSKRDLMSSKPLRRTQKLNPRNMQRLKAIMLRIKASMIRDLFIRKIKRNIYCNTAPITAQSVKKPYKSCRISGVQFSEKFEHLVIALNLLSHLTLIFLTGLSATVNNFSKVVSVSTPVVVVKIICLLASLLHFIVNIIGVTFKHGQELKYVGEIARAYIFSYDCTIDTSMIIMLILYMIFPDEMTMAAVFFCLLIPFYLKTASQMLSLEAAYIYTRKLSMFWRMAKIAFFNLMTAHIVAIIFLAISHLEPDNNWLIKAGIDRTDWYIQYVAGYYWAMIMITSIGFGDVSASNYREQIIVSFLALMGYLILGFNLSEFNNIFIAYRSQQNEIAYKKVIFRRLLNRDENLNATIDPVLKKQIYKYINDEKAEKGDVRILEINKFIADLPENLKRSYIKASNKRIFHQVLFFNKLRNETLMTLGEFFANYYLSPEEEINDPEQYISILEEGNIGLGYKKPGATINGQIFDNIKVGKRENMLLLTSNFIVMHQKPPATYSAKTYSILWCISHDAFVKGLRNDVMDFENYYGTLHKHSIDDEEWESILCPRCSSSQLFCRHSSFACPKLIYMPLRKMAVYREVRNQNFRQQRRMGDFRRSKRYQFKTSILKYWKSYIEVLASEKAMLEEAYIFSAKRIYNNYYNLSEMMVGRAHAKHPSPHDTLFKQPYDVDVPDDFDFYFPHFNIGNMVSVAFTTMPERVKNFRSTRYIPKHVYHSEILI